MEIILDTNALIYSIEHRFDLFTEIKKQFGTKIKIIVPKAVILELEKLKTIAKKQSDRLAAKIVLSILKTKQIYTPNLEGAYADKQIIDYAFKKKSQIYVITNDLLLRKKLKNKNVKVMFIRQKRFLGLE